MEQMICFIIKPNHLPNITLTITMGMRLTFCTNVLKIKNTPNKGVLELTGLLVNQSYTSASASSKVSGSIERKYCSVILILECPNNFDIS